MRNFPVVEPDTITGGGPVLILAPHQDDESLGCGGLIAACCERGQPPIVAFLTDGTGSHPTSRSHPPAALRDLREAEARAAAAALGLPPDRLVFLRQPDRHAPQEGPAFAAMVDAVAGLITQHRCRRLLGPWRHDPHCDHLAAHHIAVAAAKRTGIGLLSYPVWGWTLPDTQGELDEATPQGFRLDITRQRPRKAKAIAAHASQFGRVIRDDPCGFILNVTFLQHFEQPFEVFVIAS